MENYVGRDLTPEDGPFTVVVSVVVPDQGNSEFQGFLRVENQNDSADYDTISVDLTTPVSIQAMQTTNDQLILTCTNLYSEKLYHLS